MEGRQTKNLNLDWKFHRGDEPGAWYKGFDDGAWREVTLPHDWSVEEPFSPEHSSGTGYLPGGKGWYRKRLRLPEEWRGKRIAVTFEGVYQNARVWFNSYYLGKRPYGYSTFSYEIGESAVFGEEDNVLTVSVDRPEVADSRWFTGSGIYRDVYLTATDPLHIAPYGLFVATPEVEADRAAVSVSLTLRNASREDGEADVRLLLLDADGNEVGRAEGSLAVAAGGDALLERVIEVANPRLWSPDSPYLYTLVAEVARDGHLLDREEVAVGIRTIRFDARRGFFLNGVPTKIKGVCVHHDAGCLGAAVPGKAWERRLRELKEMGCNAIRMSHNPHAPGLLDLCDRMGFLVMDEAFDEWEGVKNKWSTGHNVYPPKHYGYYEEFPEWGERDLKDMVLRDRNHPSVILWSIGNEIDYPNDPYCHPYFETMTGNNDANKPAAERQYDPAKPNAERLAVLARRLVGWVKECDPTRPVTAAIAFPELSNLTGYTDALDVVGYNYKEHLYEEDRRRYPDRVIYGSENGPGLDAWLAVRDREDVCAQFIWTGIDYLGEARGWPVRAAPAGFLDLAGFRKTGYYYRRSLWSAEPSVHLAVRRADAEEGREARGAGGEPHWSWRAGDRLEAIGYTNAEEAELFLNGRSLGVRRLAEAPRLRLSWEVGFEPGELRIAARFADGSVREDRLRTAGAPARLVARADAAELAANGEDLAHVEIYVVDERGEPVYLADNEIRFRLTGPGVCLGLENGDVADVTAYSSPSRRAYRGRLLAYVRAGATPGTIEATAEADGLESARIVLDVRG